MVLARFLGWTAFLACFCLFAGAPPALAWSETSGPVNLLGNPTRVELVIDRLRELPAPRTVARMAVANPKIADIVPEYQSDRYSVVRGIGIGTTQLIRWDSNDRVIDTYEIVVRPDLSGLKKDIHEVFPGDDIRVSYSGRFLTLSGTVADVARLDKALALARAYLPGKDGEIVNLLQVGGVQQVMLEVRVAEISKRLGQQLGVNFGIQGRDGDFGLSLLDGLAGPNLGINNRSVSPAINAVFGFIDGNETFIIAIDALQEDGLLQILAKPTLIAQSGRSASFLAGGEFPFPVVDDDDVTIEWKPFGVALSFTPTVLGDGKISLTVSPEVSDLDFTKTLSYGGYVVPSIDTRRMSTVVELRDNQSFAIAGLMKNYVRESIAKFPLLGDIPILGALFRSTKYQSDETELVVIVTPHLVKPVDGDDLPLPTDAFTPPNPFELMLLGRLEHGGRHTGRAAGGQVQGQAPALEGDFGHIIPD